MSYHKEINELGKKLGLEDYRVIVEDGQLLLIHTDYPNSDDPKNLLEELEYGHKTDIWDILHTINNHRTNNNAEDN